MTSKFYYLGKIAVGDTTIRYCGPYTEVFMASSIMPKYRKKMPDTLYWIFFSLETDLEKQTIKKTVIEEYWKPPVEVIEINRLAKQT
jgi:hypothetical protein